MINSQQNNIINSNNVDNNNNENIKDTGLQNKNEQNNLNGLESILSNFHYFK